MSLEHSTRAYSYIHLFSLLCLQDRLRERGLLSNRLRQEIDLVHTVTLDESVAWMRDLILTLLQVIVTWEGHIESSLEECGVNIKISEDGMYVTDYCQ